MIDWKQSLYSFLLRRALGPLLDASSAQKLHDSIDFSLQEGKFVLTNIKLDAAYLTELLSGKFPGLFVRKGSVDRLEINLTLRENHEQSNPTKEQSSLAWRAMKLGSFTESFPAVSLVADSKIDGIYLDLDTIDLRKRKPEKSTYENSYGSTPTASSDTTTCDVEPTSKSIIGSYIEAALATLQLNLKLTNIHVKFFHQRKSESKELWVGVKVSSFSYNDLDVNPSNQMTVLNKSIEFSTIQVETGEMQKGTDGSTLQSSLDTIPTQSIIGLAEGSGRIFLRVIDSQPSHHQKTRRENKDSHLQRDIEIRLNHQLNFSLDINSLSRIQEVSLGFKDITEANVESDEVSIFRQSSMMNNPHIALGLNDISEVITELDEAQTVHHSSAVYSSHEEVTDIDREDLKALTGIMRQYREAYHMVEQNKMKGGILVPSNAYFDEGKCMQEVDDDMTFDVFFDANDQSLYNTVSVLTKSTDIDRDSEDPDYIHTKLRINLLGASLKINFLPQDKRQHFSHGDEYILATMNDLSISFSSTHQTHEILLDATHIQIEDAHLVHSDNDFGYSTGENSLPGLGCTVEIGNILCWAECDAYGEGNALVSQAPCLSVQWKSTKKNGKDDSIVCKVALLPLELSFRQRTMLNVSAFAAAARSGVTESKPSVAHRHSYSSEECVENDKDISLSCECPSINISFPLSEKLETSPLFERSGDVLNGRIAREHAIGIAFENTGFELKSELVKGVMPNNTCLSGKFSCLHMALFAVSPQNEVGYDTHMLRKDIFVASGRMEVNPSIPISFGFTRPSGRKEQEKQGRDSFPIIPAISSFKARQEDDDDDDENGRYIETEVDTGYRKELRGTDPQITMLANSEKSTIIFTTNIPELMTDLTTTEVETFLLILKGMERSLSTNSSTIPKIKPSPPPQKLSEKISVAVNIDKVSISIRDDPDLSESNQEMIEAKSFVFLLAMDHIKSHAFLSDSEMKHFRVFSQDLCLYSIDRKLPNTPVDRREKPAKDRFRLLKNAVQEFSDLSVTPILFRSQLFTPISQDTPSVLVDLINFSPTGVANRNELRQKRIYMTLYHLTYRYDIDSEWVKRLSNVFAHKGKSEACEEMNFETKESLSENVETSMTRLFVSCADINIDYKPPSYFSTVSRSIIRIGDLRLSCNMMKPTGLSQAYNLSIGDATYDITNDVNDSQYKNENRRLCQYSMISKEEKKCGGKNVSLYGTMPEAILRELNFVNVLSFDAMDAIVTQRNQIGPLKPDLSKDSPLALSLTMGTLSIQGCKDSFTCFANSVGELQSKLTALTNEDILDLKKAQCVSIPEPETSRIDDKPYDEFKQPKVLHSISESKIPTIADNDLRTLMLDGYEWTTVDKDDLPRLVIPPGDEQISGWYSTDSDCSAGCLLLSQIIHHHFPLHSIADPLSEGDMGARALVGHDDVFLKSRLSIQKLNIKVRLFDGYDWPDKCSAKEREAVKRLDKAFVIEPLPSSALNDKEIEKTRLRKSSSLATKTKLMGDLLDGEDIMFEKVPLPEDRVSIMNREKHLRLSKRRPNVFFQVSLNEIGLRMDSYKKSTSHRLQSMLEITVSNLFIAETVSHSRPIKMIGEWSNDYEHPRDTRFGTLMLSMATWAPSSKVTKDDELASDEANITVQLMPMRCLLDQRAISFMKAFFNNEGMDVDGRDAGPEKWSSRLHLVPPPLFKTFKIKPWKVKVDYTPIRVDVEALRDGSIVELVNLSPIQRMVIALDEVTVENSVGMGSVFGEVVSKWIQEICATQLHKFLTSARPFEPFTDVGQGLTDLVVLPYEAFKEGDSIHKAMKKGMKSLAETVVFQTLATTSGLTRIAANLMADSLGGGRGQNDVTDPLPSRPLSIPKGIGDARLHAATSLTRGFSAANYKVVVVPYREYLRNGLTGAVTSVIKGIPVLLVAPLTGATEAASYTLLGARNALRPDLRREEEASIL